MSKSRTLLLLCASAALALALATASAQEDRAKTLCAELDVDNECEQHSHCVRCKDLDQNTHICIDVKDAEMLDPEDPVKCKTKHEPEPEPKPEPEPEPEPKPEPKPEPEPQVECAKAAHHKECERPCYWCHNEYTPQGMCVDSSAAKFLPASIFECLKGVKKDDKKKHHKDDEGDVLMAFAVSEADNDVIDATQYVEGDSPWPGPPTPGPGPTPGPPSPCSTATSEDACVKGCYWCTSTFSPMGQCADETSKSFLPPSMYKCHKVKKDKPTDGVVELDQEVANAGNDMPECSLAHSGAECGAKKGCSWCSHKMSPSGQCMSEAQAKLMPPSMYECTADPEAAGLLNQTDSLQDGWGPGSGGEWGPGSGGEWGPGSGGKGGEWGPGSGGEWGPGSGGSGGSGGAGTGCTATDKKECMRPCMWCESEYSPMGQCASEQEAQFLPAMVYTCHKGAKAHDDKKPKHHDKKHDDKKHDDPSSLMAADSELQKLQDWVLDVAGASGDGGFPGSCSMAYSKDQCGKGCVWCTSEFSPFGQCKSKDEAKMPGAGKCKAVHPPIEGEQ